MDDEYYQVVRLYYISKILVAALCDTSIIFLASNKFSSMDCSNKSHINKKIPVTNFILPCWLHIATGKTENLCIGIVNCLKYFLTWF